MFSEAARMTWMCSYPHLSFWAHQSPLLFWYLLLVRNMMMAMLIANIYWTHIGQALCQTFHKGMRGHSKNPQNLFIKNCVCILTCLNFIHLQSTLYLIQYIYRDVFSTAQNSFWSCWFWCLLVFLQFFVSPLPQGQNTSLWRLWETKKSHLGVDRVNKEGGAQRSWHF